MAASTARELTWLYTPYSQLHKAHARPLPTPILFLDLSAAFDSLPPDELFGPHPPHMHQYHLQAPPPDISTATFLHNPIRHTIEQAPPHIRAAWHLIADAHRFTLTTHGNHGAAFYTHSGTKVGDPFADLSFNAFMSDIIKGISEHIPQATHIAHIPHPVWAPRNTDAYQCHDLDTTISYIDDLAILFYAHDHSELDSAIAAGMVAIRDIFHKHRLTTNYAKGNTELLYAHTDKGACTHRQDLHSCNGALLIPPPPTFPAPHIHLRTTDRYNYLGVTIHASNTLRFEVRKHASRARTAANNIPLNILRTMHIMQRVAVLDALALSQLLYSTETWCPKHPHDLKAASACLRSIHLRALGLTHVQAADAHLTNAALGLATRLRAKRLLYLPRFVHDSSTQLARLTTQHDAGLTLIRHDLYWLQQHNTQVQGFPDPRRDLQPWLLHTTQMRNWKQLVRLTAIDYPITPDTYDDYATHPPSNLATTTHTHDLPTITTPRINNPSDDYTPETDSHPPHHPTHEPPYVCKFCNRAFT